MRIFAILSLALLAACGEMGSDPGGPNKAYLVLKGGDGVEREFYLGGYDSVQDCEDIIRTELEYASERGNHFWTNSDFDYGGVQEPGWDDNLIVSSRCRLGD